MTGEIGRVAREHDDEVLIALPADERRQLHDLLSRIAAQHGLTEGVHPGYRDLPAQPAPRRVGVPARPAEQA